MVTLKTICQNTWFSHGAHSAPAAVKTLQIFLWHYLEEIQDLRIDKCALKSDYHFQVKSLQIDFMFVAMMISYIADFKLLVP